MSQFAADDFTAELKNFFITAALESCHQFDFQLQKETLDILRSIQADAAANEFHFLAQWMMDQLLSHPEDGNLREDVILLIRYLEELKTDLIDSEQRAQKYQTLKSSEVGSFLHYQYLQDDYLVPVQFVLEVIGNLKLFKLPLAQPGIFGLVIFRGDPIPVIDLFGQGLECQNYLICQNSEKIFALPITHAFQVYEFDQKVLSQLQPLKNLMASQKVTGVLSWQKKNMILLDLQKATGE